MEYCNKKMRDFQRRTEEKQDEKRSKCIRKFKAKRMTKFRLNNKFNSFYFFILKLIHNSFAM